MSQYVVLQVAQFAGAVFVLAAFFAVKQGILQPSSRLFDCLNITGSSILLSVALVQANWGFVLLNGAGVAISVVSLLRQARSLPDEG